MPPAFPRLHAFFLRWAASIHELDETMDPKYQSVQRRCEEIPLFARIVGLADVFDALCSKRVYKEAWAEEDVLETIRGESGKQFDPELVDIFFRILPRLRIIRGMYPDDED